MEESQKEIAVVEDGATELVSLDAANEYLASYAEEITDNIGHASLKYISTHKGKFKVDGNLVEGNKLICIILAYKYVNVLYTEGFDEKKLAIPACFAFSDKRVNVIPHEDVLEKKCTSCDVNGTPTCKYNKMGSAALLSHKQRKEGKACSNIMRLAILPVGYVKKGGDIIVDDSNVTTEEILFLNVPVMSVANFTNYAKKLSSGLQKRSPLGVITTIDINDDTERTLWEMEFTELKQAKTVDGKLCSINLSTSKETLPKVIARHAEAKSLIMTPYPTSLPQQAPVEGAETEATQEAVEDTDDF